ncbi:hypothetical protein B0H14DRAFT_625916 [Mycena olivaceomarginata]|nr:hypothetical protein B0H14DRAFT_625916 [Mycena olivaceomarginata]
MLCLSTMNAPALQGVAKTIQATLIDIREYNSSVAAGETLCRIRQHQYQLRPASIPAPAAATASAGTAAPILGPAIASERGGVAAECDAASAVVAHPAAAGAAALCAALVGAPLAGPDTAATGSAGTATTRVAALGAATRSRPAGASCAPAAASCAPAAAAAAVFRAFAAADDRTPEPAVTFARAGFIYTTALALTTSTALGAPAAALTSCAAFKFIPLPPPPSQWPASSASSYPHTHPPPAASQSPNPNPNPRGFSVAHGTPAALTPGFHSYPFLTRARPGKAQTLPRSTVGHTAGTAQRCLVSDREAMKQLVDCVGTSTRKKVLASGRKPRASCLRSSPCPSRPCLRSPSGDNEQAWADAARCHLW